MQKDFVIFMLVFKRFFIFVLQLQKTEFQLSQVEIENTLLKKKLKEADCNVKRLQNELVASDKVNITLNNFSESYFSVKTIISGSREA